MASCYRMNEEDESSREHDNLRDYERYNTSRHYRYGMNMLYDDDKCVIRDNGELARGSACATEIYISTLTLVMLPKRSAAHSSTPV